MPDWLPEGHLARIVAEVAEAFDLLAIYAKYDGEKQPGTTVPPPPAASVADQMRHILRTAEGQAVYPLREAVVEPAFGQIKEAREFWRFLLRGLGKAEVEWQMICAKHNLLKLFRAGWSPQSA